MAKDGKTDSDRTAGAAIQDANRSGSGVQYVQINQPLDSNGNLKPASASEYFDRPKGQGQ